MLRDSLPGQVPPPVVPNCPTVPKYWGSLARSDFVRFSSLRTPVPPSEAAGLRREFSPARPPGLGGGHCALGLVDAVGTVGSTHVLCNSVLAHEPCGGSPVQGYKGYCPGEPTVL